ncbi:MAG TPA: SRPBCC domain-containing protein [Dinghuibacter sp.]|uniref:SRPBCC domain-containing protein n=1 Tax=Dinghuibacter sp. TaxID=2024697 RepID=UPI002CAEF8E3|nr:SRPBCC domain-containing protein [Dinghuibacter sp.]HTJ14802.1 SRPBCC domain-containing protein [Dinghuibacter sp.]
MEKKTKINAEDGKQDYVITREFDLPVDLLFRAHVDGDLVGQWMGTKVLRLEGKKHGSYHFETADVQGKVLFAASGVFHEVIPDKKIIRTFEMENAPVGVQLEIYTFEALTGDTSKLHMHVIYESAALRDQVMQYGLAQGVGMAHDRLENVVKKLK